MQYDLEQVRMMMMEKMAGTLDTSEDLLLQQSIRDNPEVAALWQEIQDLFGGPVAAAVLQDLPGRQEKVWAAVEARASSQVTGLTNKQQMAEEEVAPGVRAAHPMRRITFMRIAAAACLLVVVTGTVFYFLPARKKGNIASAGTSPAKSIQLQLAGGQLIDLTASGNTIRLPEAQLNNTDKTLSFQPAAGNGDGLNTLTVPVGKDYKVVLADGTEIWMNSATVLQFPFAFRGGRREIHLSGEAYLKVASNVAQPFIVHLPQVSVEVLGTIFNVNSYDSGIVRASLVSGAIQLHSGDQELLVRPGMEGVYSPKTGLTLQPFNRKDVLSWMQGIHVFYNATVQEISKVLPRWYGIDVVLDNPQIARERFSGFIDRSKPIKDFLENLKSTHAADYYFSGETLHLK